MPTAAIVDAYSSGNLLAPEFCHRNYHCVHIQSLETIPSHLAHSFRSRTFIDRHVHTGFEETLVFLRAHKVSCVVPGSEAGVALANQLGRTLGLHANTAVADLVVRDKWEMVKTAAAAGLDVPDTLCTASLRELREWWQNRTVRRIVLKPRYSAGSEDVSVCKTYRHVSDAFASAIRKLDHFGNRNDTMLAQQFVDGKEYAVNSVSYGGVHRTVLIWRYSKLRAGDHLLYDSDDTVSHEDPVAAQLVNFVRRLLDATGVRFGASHAEVKVSGQTPVLIEIAARMDGVLSPEFDRECIGPEANQLTLTVDSYLGTTSLTGWQTPYRLARHGKVVHLIAKQTGILSGTGLERILNLDSYAGHVTRVDIGEVVSVTKDLTTSPGYVFLRNKNIVQVNRDYRLIRELERTGTLYVPVNASTP